MGRQEILSVGCAGGALLRAPERAERKVRSKAHHRPTRKAALPTTEGEDRPTGPAVWLLDAYEEQDAQAKAERAKVFVKERVQGQPLPRLEELLDLEAFRPKRGRGAGTADRG
ncbi:hypothetical protein HLB42_20040 (plasmid) [Deinococcus sp. D7000]|nr:hypothetical protein HLB42_20040 [Deinococcus sp. D7000]